ncbi:nuclear transport factor 2 family protein [Streptomyces sp. NBC_01136]|uniref:nuclear transport factor 2 family protein n=1 Tax=unclassified Streptomyces TaxID=2593676 RepID=UPI0032538C25|nr:nuclear transport factor 2 family protein [Streptomyces sp. NBC_01136]
MTLPAEDRLAITELISLHGHLFDDGRLDDLAELFTEDVVYDVSAFGQGELSGIGAIRNAALALGAANAVAHHVTNIVITDLGDGRAQVRSKGLAVMADGTCGSVSYDDIVVRRDGGWRISRRAVEARRVPLNGATGAHQ